MHENEATIRVSQVDDLTGMECGPESLAASSATISRLFREHNRSLVGYLKARLRSESEANEVAQEAYVRLLQLDNPGTPSLFRAYLFKTATNLAIDRLRRRAVRHRDRDREWNDESQTNRGVTESTEHQVIVHEQTHQLLQCLQELPVKCMQVLEMHRIDGVDQREVARRLGISDRMVRRYVTYAMVYCRLRLDGHSSTEARKMVSL